MGRTIRSIKDLDNAVCLCEGDRVYFGDIRYTVLSSYLDASRYDNNIIFEKLGIVDDMFEIASKAYGYISRGGLFPYFHEGDYHAATRFVRRLYRIMQQGNRELLATFGVCKVIDKKDFYTIDVFPTDDAVGMESVVLLHKNGNHWITNEELYKENEKFLTGVIKAVKDGISK